METYIQAKVRDGDEDTQVALFIDFENVAISAEETFGRLRTDILVQTSEQFGRCVTRRAYGDWTHYGKYSQDLLEHAIEAIQLFHYGGQSKNAADIQMVADILEMLFTHPEIDVFVLATGDSDFSAVARKLRSYGKRVIGVGLRQATSEVLVKACDQFLIYDTIVEPVTRTQSYSLEQARQLLLSTLSEMIRETDGEPVLAAALKHRMLQKDPTFSQVKLGFTQFKDFLAEQQDTVKLGVRENQVIVSLNPSITEKASNDPTLEYRKALDREGLILLDPYTRTEVLRDLFALLRKNPGRFTLLSAETQLKATYDSTNILRTRDEVHEAIRLVRYTDAIAPTPQSWELDTLTIKPGLDQYGFIDECEGAYVAALVTRNLLINPGIISMLLFGTTDKKQRVTQLVSLVTSKGGKPADHARRARALQLPPRIAGSLPLKPILKDLEECKVDGEITLERATQASETGMRVRTSDFEKAKQHFLMSAKIIYLLLQDKSPGASMVDLEWQLSGYCSSAAGAAFFNRNYPAAVEYYLAFFSIAVETEPVWEKVDRLVLPMLSFYFTNAANLQSVSLDISPGNKHPAHIANLVLNHPNPQVVQCGRDLAQRLAQINPALLRKIIQRLDAISKQGNGEYSSENKTQQILLEILNAPGQAN